MEILNTLPTIMQLYAEDTLAFLTQSGNRLYITRSKIGNGTQHYSVCTRRQTPTDDPMPIHSFDNYDQLFEWYLTT